MHVFHLSLHFAVARYKSSLPVAHDFVKEYCQVYHTHIDGLVQDCSDSSALAMELLQSGTKPSI